MALQNNLRTKIRRNGNGGFFMGVFFYIFPIFCLMHAWFVAPFFLMLAAVAIASICSSLLISLLYQLLHGMLFLHVSASGWGLQAACESKADKTKTVGRTILYSLYMYILILSPGNKLPNAFGSWTSGSHLNDRIESPSRPVYHLCIWMCNSKLLVRWLAVSSPCASSMRSPFTSSTKSTVSWSESLARSSI